MELKDFEKPSETTQYTIYSKSGCPNCKKVKELLETQKITFTVIQELTSREWKTFPIVFNNDQFIGGFTDTRVYLENLAEKNLDFTDETF
jgi:glutaredoxin